MSILIVFLSMLLSSPQGAPVKSVNLSLEEAVSVAFERQPGLRLLEQEIQRARATTLIDSALPAAEAGLSVEGLGLSEKARRNDPEYSLGLTQPLPFPGKLGLKSSLGETYEQEASLQLEKGKILLAAQVKKAYLKCLLSQQAVDFMSQNLETLNDIQHNALSRYSLGSVPYSEVLRLKIELVRSQNDLYSARQELAADFSRLKLLLGFEEETTINLTSALTYQELPDRPEALLAKARATSPTLKLAGLKKGRSELLVKLARKDRWPDFSLSFFTPSRRWGAVGFSLGVNWPLFSRKSLKGEKLLAESEQQRAQISLEAADRFFDSQKRLALAAVDQAGQRVKIFEDSLLEDSKAELEKALNAYRLGQLDSLHLLDLFQAARQMNFEYQQAIYFYLCALADFYSAGEDYE
ncbi:MAG TPA: TolC family protein [Candidatus Saccharicenans sp.]|jgi:outer membrane protein TolC|nr:TolC family protein [Candidatus Saccharicenans sp.]HOM93437.1 TolC family protein [Candidatus Saccharicenans sp.]HOT68162.1 TolC family protein [Candidatus Saccharicenans sp.]HPC87430.1 TolC family protein [Candidatus Saccharicenans sp.]HQE63538.1 TolC family protein [Candidatus Saccharicenans sp.]